MIHFNEMNKSIFLNEYWQKKPLLLKQALPDFENILSADELAGLALEEDVDSKLVFEKPGSMTQWALKQGPFLENDFKTLPPTHWTLLVQGVDRLMPEVNFLLDHFDFLPQWRIDDVMISVAGLHGGVGPHFDNYDVFLYQASGERKWSITTKNCNIDNAMPDLELRIMADFEVEQEFILSEGDMLYLPPHVGHHGVSLTEESIGYSFGYRSYQSQELWDSFGDFLSEVGSDAGLYKDPNWKELRNTAEIPRAAYLEAKKRMQSMLDNDAQCQAWFTRFATSLDSEAMQIASDPLSDDEIIDMPAFMETLKNSSGVIRDLTCRIAYHNNHGKIHLCINGDTFDYGDASNDLIKLIASKRRIFIDELAPMISDRGDQHFLYALWKDQYIHLNA